MTSKLTRAQRAHGVAEAFASAWLEGIPITYAARRGADDYIDGRKPSTSSSRT